MALPRVLVVHDDEDARELVATALEAKGFEVVTFAGGAEALARAEHSAPPVALFLGSLRHYVELREQIDARTATGRLRVIVATGAYVRIAPSFPGVLVMKKPFELEDLVSALQGAHVAA